MKIEIKDLSSQVTLTASDQSMLENNFTAMVRHDSDNISNLYFQGTGLNCKNYLIRGVDYAVMNQLMQMIENENDIEELKSNGNKIDVEKYTPDLSYNGLKASRFEVNTGFDKRIWIAMQIMNYTCLVFDFDKTMQEEDISSFINLFEIKNEDVFSHFECEKMKDTIMVHNDENSECIFTKDRDTDILRSYIAPEYKIMSDPESELADLNINGKNFDAVYADIMNDGESNIDDDGSTYNVKIRSTFYRDSLKWLVLESSSEVDPEQNDGMPWVKKVWLNAGRPADIQNKKIVNIILMTKYKDDYYVVRINEEKLFETTLEKIMQSFKIVINI